MLWAADLGVGPIVSLKLGMHSPPPNLRRSFTGGGGTRCACTEAGGKVCSQTIQSEPICTLVTNSDNWQRKPCFCRRHPAFETRNVAPKQDTHT